MQEESQKTLLLVDGYSYLYRDFHHNLSLRARLGKKIGTGAIYGTMLGIKNLTMLVKADFHVCVFDAQGPSFRDEWKPRPITKRSTVPNELRVQIEPIHEFMELFGWKTLTIPGMKAVDVLGTLANNAVKQGIEVIVSSGNLDVIQLVNEQVAIFDVSPRIVRNVEGVASEFGVPPSLIGDYQVLVGGTIEGFVGPLKRSPAAAAKLLLKYGSLQGVIENSAGIPGNAGENIRLVQNILSETRKFLNIKTDCDLREWIPSWPSMEFMTIREEDTPSLRAFYKKFGFKLDVKAIDDAIERARRKAMPKSIRKASEQRVALVSDVKERLYGSTGSNGDTAFVVYRIRNSVTKRQYFGSTNNPLRRWSDHLRDLENGSHPNLKLYKDFQANGIGSFEFRILNRCKSIEEARAIEQRLITMYWGRANCLNAAQIVEIENGPDHYIAITAELQAFRTRRNSMRGTNIKLQGAITKLKGWGQYLSVHGAARDLGLSKAEVEAALDDPSKNVSGWFFTSSKVSVAIRN